MNRGTRTGRRNRQSEKSAPISNEPEPLSDFSERSLKTVTPITRNIKRRNMMESKLIFNSQVHLVAAAAASAAASAASGGSGGFGGSSIASAVCSGEDRKLDGSFSAGALGAGDFLLLIDYNLFKARFALVTYAFVDGHRGCFLCSIKGLTVSCPIIAAVAVFGGSAPPPLFVTAPSHLFTNVASERV